jgi:hypothetical protein
VDFWTRKEIIMLEKAQIVDRIEVVKNAYVLRSTAFHFAY